MSIAFAKGTQMGILQLLLFFETSSLAHASALNLGL
jgi:hypothetical protein